MSKVPNHLKANSSMRDRPKRILKQEKKGKRDYVYLPMIVSEHMRLHFRNGWLLSTAASLFMLIFIAYYTNKANAFLTGQYPLIEKSHYFMHSFIYVNWSACALGALLQVASFYVSFKSKFNPNRVWLLESNYLYVCAIALRCATIVTIMVLIYVSLIHDTAHYEYNNAILQIINQSSPHEASYARRQLLDTIQSEEQCCGSSSYADWSISPEWADLLESKCDGYFAYIPPSCCNIESKVGCFDFVPVWANISELYEKNHYTRGCASGFVSDFNFYVERIFYIWSILCAIFFWNHILMEYFRVSIHFSVLLTRHSQVEGFGWLFGPSVDTVALFQLMQKDITAEEVLCWKVQIHLKKVSKARSNKSAIGDIDKKLLTITDRIFINNRGVVSSMDGEIAFRMADNIIEKDQALKAIKSNKPTMSRIEST